MPDLSRRSALLLGGSALLGSLGLASTDAEAATIRGRRIADQLAMSRTASPIPLRTGFVPLIGSNLTATSPRTSHRLTLLQVNDLGSAAAYDRCFTLILQVVGSARLAEGIYRLGSSRLPGTALLLSPVGQDVAGRPQRVQAVINRL